MTVLRNHIILMFLYAFATGLFFALLWRSETHERVRFFIILFLSLMLGGILLGWVMYPAPFK